MFEMFKQQHSRQSDRKATVTERIQKKSQKKFRYSNECHISNGVTVSATARETGSVSG
jgi:hypothetical protein